MHWACDNVAYMEKESQRKTLEKSWVAFHDNSGFGNSNNKKRSYLHVMASKRVEICPSHKPRRFQAYFGEDRDHIVGKSLSHGHHLTSHYQAIYYKSRTILVDPCMFHWRSCMPPKL